MKNLFKKMLCCTLAFLCLPVSCMMYGCDSEMTPENEDTTPAQTEPETEEPFVYENKIYNTLEHVDKFKIVGRSTLTDTGIAADWSGSGVEFYAQCKGAIRASITSSDANSFAVIVDGEFVKDIDVKAGTNTYFLTGDLSEGVHHVRLLKQRAYIYLKKGLLASIDSITVKGALLERPADKEYLIEVIGDSIASGGGTAPEHTLPMALNSFGFLLAEKLNADYSLVCTPGLSTYATSLHVHTLYEWQNAFRDNTTKYTTDRPADLVVIHLNANDYQKLHALYDETPFKNSVKTLLNNVYTIHGKDVKIVWFFEMMVKEETGDQWVREVFDEMGGESAGLYYLNVTQNQQGGNKHPSAQAHKVVCDELYQFIQSKNLLD